METLFDFAAKHARISDPHTSHEAASQAQPMAKRHVELIASFLRRIAPNGAAADIIAAGIKIDRHKVLKRLSDAERAGLIYTTGETRMMSTGRKGRVWKAVQKA